MNAVKQMNRHRRVRHLVRQQGWIPVDAELNDFLYWDMRRWCEQMFAPNDWDGSLRGYTGVKFVFKNHKDAMLFTMRWI